MAHEVTDWKTPNCTLTLSTDQFSDREIFSREINETFGEGGGLNANYRTVEAVAKAASILGLNGFRYGVDFIFKTAGLDTIVLDFLDLETKRLGESAFRCYPHTRTT